MRNTHEKIYRMKFQWRWNTIQGEEWADTFETDDDFTNYYSMYNQARI